MILGILEIHLWKEIPVEKSYISKKFFWIRKVYLENLAEWMTKFHRQTIVTGGITRI